MFQPIPLKYKAVFARKVHFSSLQNLSVVEISDGEKLLSRGYSQHGFQDATEAAIGSAFLGSNYSLTWIDDEVHEIAGGRAQSDWQ